MLYLKGIVLLVVVFAVFITAFIFKKQNRIAKSLIFIVLGGAILRGWCLLTDRFLYHWDERYHALVGKNMAENPFVPMLFKNQILDNPYQSWVMSHVWLHKQPLTLWLIAGSIRLFGATEWAVRLPSVVLSLVGIYLTFRIASFFKNQQVGLLAAFFHAINGLVIEIATGRMATDHPDSQFLFFIELAVFFSTLFVEKKHFRNLLLIGIALGLAILTKWLPALIVLPIFALLTFDTEGGKKTIFNLSIISFTATVIALPWQIYILKTFPAEANWEYTHHVLHITTILDGQGGSVFQYIWWSMRNWNELFLLIFGWFLWSIWQNKEGTVEQKKALALIIWIVIPYVFFSFVKTKMMAYVLFVAPAVFTILAIFWESFRLNSLKIKWLNTLLLTAVLAISIRYGYERLFLFKDRSSEIELTNQIKNLNPDSQTLILNTENYVEIMFYTNAAAAYPSIPPMAKIDSLILRGYKIWIMKDDKLPTDLLRRKDVTVFTLKMGKK